METCRVTTERFIAALAVLAILSVPFLPRTASADAYDKARAMVGKKAPDFVFSDLEGKRHEFREGTWKNHRAVVVNFWGLRCAACILEMPYLEALHKKYAPEGLFVVGANVDGVDAATIREKMKQLKLGVGYCIAEDPEMKLVDLFHMAGAPLTFVIDAKGTVRHLHEGFEEGDEKEMEKVIDMVLKDR